MVSYSHSLSLKYVTWEIAPGLLKVSLKETSNGLSVAQAMVAYSHSLSLPINEKGWLCGRRVDTAGRSGLEHARNGGTLHSYG